MAIMSIYICIIQDMNIMAVKYMVWPAEALHMSSKLIGKSKKRLISGHAAIDSLDIVDGN